jgi:hypothetical protein
VVAFTAAVDVEAPVEATWAALVDWPSHARWVPFTRIRVLTPSGAGVGARFVARTGVGPLGFDDPMEIVLWQPPTADRPGECEVVKQGRVVLGGAHLEVAPLPGGRSRATWREEVEVVPVRLTRPFGRLIGAAARRAFTRTLRVMAAEVEATTGTARGAGEGAGNA